MSQLVLLLAAMNQVAKELEEASSRGARAKASLEGRYEEHVEKCRDLIRQYLKYLESYTKTAYAQGEEVNWKAYSELKYRFTEALRELEEELKESKALTALPTVEDVLYDGVPN
jgi:F0F1-type ATP synthase membrane subunit b/b'